MLVDFNLGSEAQPTALIIYFFYFSTYQIDLKASQIIYMNLYLITLAIYATFAIHPAR
jgi:hypothetical protein